MTNVIVLSNIAALEAYSGGSSSPAIWVEGYTTAGDGGEGMFTYVSSDTSSANNYGTIIIDGTGTNRYYRQHRLCPYNILWFGGNGNGSTDNTTAINHALAALPSGGGEIFFPPGKYLVDSAITYTIPSGTFSITFAGPGADICTLYWPTTSGFIIEASSSSHSVHFRDMTITTGQACGQTGVEITQSVYEGQFEQSDFTRVTFRGDPSVSGSYWGCGIFIDGLSNVAYDTVFMFGNFTGDTSGTGLSINGGSNEYQNSVVHNISKCGFFYFSIGLLYGTYVQGVTISQTTFDGGTTGISIASDQTFDAELTIMSSEFNTSGNQIDIESPIASLTIIGNLFYVPDTKSGVYINSGGFFATINGNVFSGPNTSTSYGVNVPADFYYGVVTGNVFYNVNTGVDLSGASGWNVQANVYAGVPTQIVPGTGNTHATATN